MTLTYSELTPEQFEKLTNLAKLGEQCTQMMHSMENVQQILHDRGNEISSLKLSLEQMRAEKDQAILQAGDVRQALDVMCEKVSMANQTAVDYRKIAEVVHMRASITCRIMAAQEECIQKLKNMNQLHFELGQSEPMFKELQKKLGFEIGGENE